MRAAEFAWERLSVDVDDGPWDLATGLVGLAGVAGFTLRDSFIV
jgi:hypothetical protein